MYLQGGRARIVFCGLVRRLCCFAHITDDVALEAVQDEMVTQMAGFVSLDQKIWKLMEGERFTA